MQRRQETNQPRNSKQRSQHHACSNTNPEGEKEICIQPENSIPQGKKTPDRRISHSDVQQRSYSTQ